jgi:hypothetical protein
MARFLGVEKLFERCHFDREIIVLCVRWYLRFKLSFRDLVEMMAERGLPMAHTTIIRWVRHYAPEFERPLESVRAAGRSIVACGRVGLSVTERPSPLSPRSLRPYRGDFGQLQPKTGLLLEVCRKHLPCISSARTSATCCGSRPGIDT